MPFSWFCPVTLTPTLCRQHHMEVYSTTAHGTPSNLWRYLRVTRNTGREWLVKPIAVLLKGWGSRKINNNTHLCRCSIDTMLLLSPTASKLRTEWSKAIEHRAVTVSHCPVPCSFSTHWSTRLWRRQLAPGSQRYAERLSQLMVRLLGGSWHYCH